MKSIFKTWIAGGVVMRKALREQQVCIADIYQRLGPYLHTSESTHPDYRVRPGVMPLAFLAARRNIFSTLFHSAYFMLGLPESRRMLYGRLIHLYRIWVTSADNLLDDEDKLVVPMEMPGKSRVMRQVVSIMAADRVLADLLNEQVSAGWLDEAARSVLLQRSLQALLPSAAQGASEEAGIEQRPYPDHVLNVIHRLKTGMLFNVAFVGPESLETRLDGALLAVIKDAMMQVGLGCQLLDDIRDLARDMMEKRHNYVLAWLAHHDLDALANLMHQAVGVGDRIYWQVPQAVIPAAERGFGLIKQGLVTLGAAGLECGEDEAAAMAGMMFKLLDLEDMAHVCPC